MIGLLATLVVAFFATQGGDVRMEASAPNSSAPHVKILEHFREKYRDSSLWVGNLRRVDVDVDGDGSADLLLGSSEFEDSKGWSAAVYVRRTGACFLGEIHLSYDTFYLDSATGLFRVMTFPVSLQGAIQQSLHEYDLRGSAIREVSTTRFLRAEYEERGLFPAPDFQEALDRSKATSSRWFGIVSFEEAESALAKLGPVPWVRNPSSPGRSTPGNTSELNGEAVGASPRYIQLGDPVVPTCPPLNGAPEPKLP